MNSFVAPLLGITVAAVLWFLVVMPYIPAK